MVFNNRGSLVPPAQTGSELCFGTCCPYVVYFDRASGMCWSLLGRVQLPTQVNWLALAASTCIKIQLLINRLGLR